MARSWSSRKCGGSPLIYTFGVLLDSFAFADACLWRFDEKSGLFGSLDGMAKDGEDGDVRRLEGVTRLDRLLEENETRSPPCGFSTVGGSEVSHGTGLFSAEWYWDAIEMMDSDAGRPRNSVGSLLSSASSRGFAALFSRLGELAGGPDMGNRKMCV
ncbi:hypothetical protein B0H19DRAFT_1129891 [Mycena capillaripes]|nr:hypothetical protein B0H19DRAFT_1129891 [Mycena capillaripes]